MQTFSITEGRRKLGELVNIVKYQRRTIALGSHGKPEVLLIAYTLGGGDDMPMAAMNAQSSSFAFLQDEPDLYSAPDVKHPYA